MASLVGSRVERKEDARFLTGKGRYTADINIAIKRMQYLLGLLMQEQKLKKLIHLKL